MEDYNSNDPIDIEVAEAVLKELSVSPNMDIKEIEKQVIEVSIEKKGLKETFDKIIKDFTQYEKIEKNSKAREYNRTLTRNKESNEVEK